MWWEGGKRRRESSSLLPSDHPLLPQCALRSKTTDDESDAGTNYPGGQSRPNSPVSLVQYCNCLIGWQNWSSGDSQKRSFEEILVSNQGQTRNRLDQDQVARLVKPLYSGLAARLYLVRIPAEIPSNLQSQGWYWKKYYNTVAGKGTVTKFINDVRRASGCAA